MFSSTKQILWRTQHLILTGSGTWWAMWRLQALTYTGQEQQIKIDAKDAHEALFQELRGESLLLGLTTQENHLEVINRMMEGVRMDQCAEYLEEVELTLGALEQMTIGARAHFLAIPLRPADIRARAISKVRASWQGIQHAAALPASRPSGLEIQAALEAAAHWEALIPAVFDPIRSTPAEVTWIHYQAQTRGITGNDPLPEVDRTATPSELFRTGRELVAPHVDEGGQADASRIGRLIPFKRRFLKLHTVRSEQPSYQSMLALTGTPDQGWTFPGAEWLSWLDKLPFDVDWAIRLHVISQSASIKKNQKSESTLDDQIQQQSTAVSTITGNANNLDKNIRDLGMFHSKMKANERETEVQATLILAVGGASADEVTEKARLLKESFKKSFFTLDDVLGEQENLWEAMQPGIPTSPIVRELAQLAPASEFASCVPLITFDIGDHHGMLFAENLETAQGRPVFLDQYGSTKSNMSGSMAFVGALGSGKSVSMKKLGGLIVKRGGKIFVIDKSATAEYAVFAQALAPEQTAVVEILNPKWSLDPIRMFGTRKAPQMTQSFLTALLRMETFDVRGQLLGDLLHPAYLQKHEIGSMKALLDHLLTLENEPTAVSLANAMKVVAGKPDLSAVLFDESLPPFPLDAQASVFCTRGLSLPSNTELQGVGQWANMSLAKIFSAAIYELLAEIGREICFASSAQFAAFIADEAHHMTMQARGAEVCMEFVREGRKTAAAIFIGSQAPKDLGPKEMRDLIPVKVVHRLPASLAEDGAQLLVGTEAIPAQLVKEIQGLSPIDKTNRDKKVVPGREGECFILDSMGRYGRARVMLPFEPHMREAVLTTPPEDVPLDLVEA